ncbi:MAG: AAA family ATPase [Eubacteriaceae bacterium]|nr:AAA family ATPase [Eubacteriaceae bacterium]
MKIKTLNLLAFGKFIDKTIEIDDGFNLIFGGNEAGKSTVQHFIEGMLFGFYKPYRKKRTYNENYYHYKPRHSDKYYGSMIMEDDNGKEIRIERDFLKTRDGVRIFNNITGEEITQTYPYDHVTKQYLPLGYGSVNSVVYNNTVNFKQMASRSDDDLAKEVNNRLVDLVTDNSDDISVNGVLDYLKSKKEAVGTFGKSKSNYGMAVRERNNLRGILKDTEEIYQKVNCNQKRIQQYEKKIERLNQVRAKQAKEMGQKKQAALDKQKAAIAQTKDRIEQIKNDNAALHQKLDDLLYQYGSFDQELFSHLQFLKSSMEGLIQRIEKLTEQIGALESEKDETQKRLNHMDRNLKGLTRQQLEDDYKEYRIAKSNGDLYNQEQDQWESHLERQHQSEDWIDLQRFSIKPLLALMIAGILLIALSFLNPAQFMAFAVQVIICTFGLVLFLTGFIVIIIRKNDFKSVALPANEGRENLDGMDTEDVLASDEDNHWRSSLEIMKAYGQSNEADFEKMVLKLHNIFKRYESLQQESDRCQMKIDSVNEEKKALSEEKESYQGEIEERLDSLGFKSLEDYGEISKHLGEIEKLRAEIAANNKLYDELSGNDYIIALPNDADDNVIIPEEQKRIHTKGTVEALEHEKAILLGENTSMMNGVGNPVAIREQIEGLDHQIENYEMELRACDMAESFFNNFKKETHYEQATNLNERIGTILDGITHKYHQVKVDDALQVKVVNPENNDLLGIEQLSGGTIDQIYFALRFGVRDIVDRNQTLPFILDDPFVQYDDQRKNAAIQFLYKSSEENQILLFTCSGDEKRMMDDNQLTYTGIGL